MKKMIIILISLCIASIAVCQSKKEAFAVLRTYYGVFSTDTIKGVVDKDGSLYYNIIVVPMDSELSKAFGVDAIYNVISYNPFKNVYFSRMIGSDNSYGPRVYFNPINGKTDSIK